MQKTPLSNRLHIGIFGRRNAGKSTLINALTGQEIAIVSEIAGTTTDPVYKAMEIHDIGPVVLIDTGGIDDEGPIGAMRVDKAYKVLNKTDVALLVYDKAVGTSNFEDAFLTEVKKRGIPVIAVINKGDAAGSSDSLKAGLASKKVRTIEISALKKTGIDELRQEIVVAAPEDFERKMILRDMLAPSDLVMIVAPLDIEAPKGRLKLPQVQTIRDILDSDCSTIVVKETDVLSTIANLKTPPKLVIAESQVFAAVAKMLPAEIPLTSFSALYARYKGELDVLVEGVRAIDTLTPDDHILIAEACTHHPIGDDIGRVVLPRLLAERLGVAAAALHIDHVAGYDFPKDLARYKLVIHCGGCMLNRRDMVYRIRAAQEKGLAITNYGMAIAHLSGLLDRMVEPFGLAAVAAA